MSRKYDINQNLLKNTDVIGELLKFKVVYLASQITSLLLESQNNQKLSFKEAWDLHAGAQLVELGISFSQQFTYEKFKNAIKFYNSD